MKMRIESRDFGVMKGRTQSVMTLNNDVLKKYGFEPGSVVNIVFGKEKMILVNDLEKYILDKAKKRETCCLIPKETDIKQ